MLKCSVAVMALLGLAAEAAQAQDPPMPRPPSEQLLDVSWFRNTAYLYPNRVRINSTSYYSVTSAVAAPSPIYDSTCVLPRAAPQQCSTVREYLYYPKNGAPSTDRSDGPYLATEHYLTADKDSGAPWIYANVAQGIHLGSVVLGGYTRSLFSPVSSLPKIGLSVVTTP